MAQADPAERILRAASRLLTEEGPEALTNRRIADEAGCTTMAIYSRYGSKGGVLEALFDEGIARICEAQRSAVPGLPPLAAVEAMCLAYRRVALGYPGHYWLVFGPPPKGFRPSDAARRGARRTFGVLARAVARAVEAGDLAGDPDAIALEVFAVCHGHVALALADRLPLETEPESAYIAAVRGVLSGYAVNAQVGIVGRLEDGVAARSLDGVTDLLDPVGAEVVEDDDVPGTQLEKQDRVDIGLSADVSEATSQCAAVHSGAEEGS